MYAGGGLIGERLGSSSQPQARHLVDQPVAANSKLGPHPLDRPSLLERAGLQIASARTGAERWGTPPAEALAARAEALRARACLQAEAEAGRAAVRLAFAEPIFRPSWPMAAATDENRACPAKLGFPWCERARYSD